MSYILDALQRSAADNSPQTPTSQPHAAPGGMGLAWKIAVGAVLATNLLLLYLWRSDRAAEPSNPIPAAMAVDSGIPTDLTPGQTQRSAPADRRQINNAPAKKTLPGIASPRDLPQQREAAAAARPPAAAPRTFRPTGAQITIADASPAQPQAVRPDASPATTQAIANPASMGTSTLGELSASAREALYVLSFSTHIYGADSDLRAVVVNGQRLTEGKAVTAENGQTFLLQEITDNGVIMRFEHEGAIETVEIPVMEDWKDD